VVAHWVPGNCSSVLYYNVGKSERGGSAFFLSIIWLRFLFYFIQYGLIISNDCMDRTANQISMWNFGRLYIHNIIKLNRKMVPAARQE